LEMGSHTKLFTWAGLGPQSSQCQPPKLLGLQVWATSIQSLFSTLNPIYSQSSLYDLLPSACFGFNVLFFSSFSRSKFRLLIWYVSSYLMEAFIAVTFPPVTAFATSHKILNSVFILICLEVSFTFLYQFLFDPLVA
jgi:hypothetical protein